MDSDYNKIPSVNVPHTSNEGSLDVNVNPNNTYNLATRGYVWEAIASVTGEFGGTVNSVNDIGPDQQGNVEVSSIRMRDYNGSLNEVRADLIVLSGGIEYRLLTNTDYDALTAYVDDKTKDITASSDEWNAATVLVTSTSGAWNGVVDAVSSTSGAWNGVVDAVSSVSGSWNGVVDAVSSASGTWNGASDLVTSTSGTWNGAASAVSTSSGSWNSVYTTVGGTSASWTNHVTLCSVGADEDHVLSYYTTSIASPSVGDVLVLKKELPTLGGGKYAYSAFSYTGSAWAAMQGSYCSNGANGADDVFVTRNLTAETTYLSPTGYVTDTSVLNVSGKNVTKALEEEYGLIAANKVALANAVSSVAGLAGSVTELENGKMDRPSTVPASGHFAAFMGGSDAADSGYSPADFAPSDIVPSDAASGNLLATEGFVNSSIGTNTAFFLGTYSYTDDLGLEKPSSTEEVEAAIANDTVANALSSVVATSVTAEVSNNDYAFVSVEFSDQTIPGEYLRFKYSGADDKWEYEYTLNNSSFTSKQWGAINSGVTSGDVEKLGTIDRGAQVNVIESVSVNDVPVQPSSGKTVNIDVPVRDVQVDGSTVLNTETHVANVAIPVTGVTLNGNSVMSDKTAVFTTVSPSSAGASGSIADAKLTKDLLDTKVSKSEVWPFVSPSADANHVVTLVDRAANSVTVNASGYTWSDGNNSRPAPSYDSEYDFWTPPSESGWNCVHVEVTSGSGATATEILFDYDYSTWNVTVTLDSAIDGNSATVSISQPGLHGIPCTVVRQGDVYTLTVDNGIYHIAASRYSETEPVIGDAFVPDEPLTRYLTYTVLRQSVSSIAFPPSTERSRSFGVDISVAVGADAVSWPSTGIAYIGADGSANPPALTGGYSGSLFFSEVSANKFFFDVLTEAKATSASVEAAVSTKRDLGDLGVRGAPYIDGGEAVGLFYIDGVAAPYDDIGMVWGVDVFQITPNLTRGSYTLREDLLTEDFTLTAANNYTATALGHVIYGVVDELAKESQLPSVPTISTNVSADAESDTTTTSPKAVKTYVDATVGAATTLTPVYSQTPTWAYDGLPDGITPTYMPPEYDEQGFWMFGFTYSGQEYYGEVPGDGTEKRLSITVARLVPGDPPPPMMFSGINAYRTDIIGYTLGSQTAKPLQPKLTATQLSALDAVSGKAEASSLAPLYSALSSYSASAVVMHDGLRYVCNSDISSPEAWTPAHWTEETVQTALGNIDVSSQVAGKLNSVAAAPDFVPSAAYAVGEYVTFEGDLYSCVSALSATTPPTVHPNPPNDLYSPSATANHWKSTDMATPDATLDVTADGGLRVVTADGVVLWQSGYDLGSPTESTSSAAVTSLAPSAGTESGFSFYKFSTDVVEVTLPVPVPGPSKVGDFILEVRNPSLGSEFSSSETYSAGVTVTHDGAVWTCTAAVTASGAWTGTTNWTETYSAYSSSASYSSGDYAVQDGKLWKCTATPASSGAFDEAYWQTASLKIAGLPDSVRVLVPKGDVYTDMMTVAPGDFAQFYFTQSTFSEGGLPTWKVVRQDCEAVS